MAKKCEQCGAPAVDAQSLFCNLCGGCLQDEPEPVPLVCKACGIPAPDDQSVFCTRCGREYAAGQDNRYPVCSSCGSVVPDQQAVFCNRCGAKLSPELAPPVPVIAPVDTVSGIQALLKTSKKATSPITRKTPGLVIVTRKKHSASPPVQAEGYIPDEPPTATMDYHMKTPKDSEAQENYDHLPLAADDSTVDIPPRKHQTAKRYAHLPLVADELKVKDIPPAGFFSNGAREPSSPPQKKHSPKKGIMGRFRQ